MMLFSSDCMQKEEGVERSNDTFDPAKLPSVKKFFMYVLPL